MQPARDKPCEAQMAAPISPDSPAQYHGQDSKQNQTRVESNLEKSLPMQVMTKIRIMYIP